MNIQPKNFTYQQILELVRHLPLQDKVKISRELERELVDAKLGELLEVFKTDELTEEEILKEIEAVRAERYARKKAS
ncbi:MAG: hypothetical protein V4642_01405 [Bacteroidota bacterium]